VHLDGLKLETEVLDGKPRLILASYGIFSVIYLNLALDSELASKKQSSPGINKLPLHSTSLN
uniref:Uncharacterized protein n=1 Tax=Anas zonorhyncha TaxID=75864 RepID=A0A8B9VLJ9_9AVES